MNKKVLDFVNKLEGYKTAIKQLHWDAKNMSQHELCDDIAESIAEFQDTVSEVEQSITGKLKVNSLKPTEYKIKDLKSFVEDVLDVTNNFYKEVKDMGDTYVGMTSDCESFLSDMQRKLYLVNFTLKEELKERLKAKINESMPKNLANHDEVDKFMGRKPKSIKARINQVYRIVKKYGIDSKVYHDENWQAISDYYRAISSLGCEVEMKPCASLSNADSMESDGGYTDYDPYDNMPRSKQYAIKIMFEDGMNIDGYIKCMAAGTVEDPFSRYDTCIVLWPKNNRVLEDRKMRNESINENDFMNKWFDRNEEDHLAKAREGLWRRDRENFYNNHPDFRPSNGQVEEGINEYGDKPETREKMGAVAKRGIMKGDVKPYQRAMSSLGKRGSRKEDYVDFQRGFENENRQIKLSEAELKQVVKEAAIKILNETPLNYDVDNFSGRWTKSEPSDEEWALADSRANGDYLDDPFHAPNSWDDDEWVDGDKDMENDYSWGLYHRMNNVGKSPIDRQHDIMDAAQNRRDHAAYWTDKDNERGRKLMDKWINGKRDTDELGDVDFSYDPYKYNESKRPMKVTEAELKQVVKEAAVKLIKEYGDSPKGQYMLGKLAARQRFRDNDPHKGARTHYYAGFHAPENERKYKQWARAREVGYQDGKKEFSKETDESIEIKPENKGKFTATKKATGKSTEELTHSKNPLTRKRAIFAQNAKKWAKK